MNANEGSKFVENDKSALIIIDIQNDFCTGSMASEDFEPMIDKVNQLRKQPMFNHIIRTRDWHPKDHISFQSNNPGAGLFENFYIEKHDINQIMWPDHCIQGSEGAKFHKKLVLKPTDIQISKGTKTNVEAISAFGSEQENTGLYKRLSALKIGKVYCVGIAFDS